MSDGQWWSVGRWSAWTGAACFLASSIVALLISSEATVPPPPHLAPGADLDSFTAEALDWKRTVWPQGLAVDLLLLMGALTFVPLGLALCQVFGAGSVKHELMVSSFTVGALLAATGVLVAAGVTRFAVVSSVNPDLPSSALPIMDILEVGARSALAWLVAGFLSLMGIGVLLGGRAGAASPTRTRSDVPSFCGWHCSRPPVGGMAGLAVGPPTDARDGSVAGRADLAGAGHGQAADPMHHGADARDTHARDRPPLKRTRLIC